MSHTNGIGSSPLLSTLLHQTDRVGGSGAQKGAVTNGSVSLTSDSAQLSSTASVLSQAVSSTSDVRTEKVAALKAAISAGNYSVPAGAVADKLIDHLLR